MEEYFEALEQAHAESQQISHQQQRQQHQPRPQSHLQTGNGYYHNYGLSDAEVSPVRMQQEYLSNSNVFPAFLPESYGIDGNFGETPPSGLPLELMDGSPSASANQSQNSMVSGGIIPSPYSTDGSTSGSNILNGPSGPSGQSGQSGQSVSSIQPNLSSTSNNTITNANIAVPPRIVKMRPCDECRRRKSGCNRLEDSDTCLTCQVNGIQCTFVEGPRPRKRNAAGRESQNDAHTSTAGSDSGLLTNGGGSNGTSSGSSGIGAGGSGGSSSVGGGSGIGVDGNNTTDGGRKRIKTESVDDESSRFQNPIQDYSLLRGHSLLKKTLSLQYPRSSRYVGDTAVFDSVLLDSGTYNKKDEADLPGNVSLRKAAPDAVFMMITDDGPQESVEDVDEIEKLASPYGKQLINLYFRILHPSFPILDQEVFLEKYSRTHREFVPCLLAAVYILALKWWYYDVSLSSLPKPDISSQLYKLGVASFQKICSHPKIPVVQAGILLVQCKPSDERNWIISSQVVACAERIGLGLNCQNWKVPKWERGLRKRLGWAVYLLDKWLSLIEAHPSHISENYWLVGKLTSDDFYTSKVQSNNLSVAVNNNNNIQKKGYSNASSTAALGEQAAASNTSDGGGKTSPTAHNTPPSTISTTTAITTTATAPIPPMQSSSSTGQLFVEMIALSQIVNEILDSLFTYRSKATIQRTEDILNIAKPIQIKLRGWYLNLPDSLKMVNSDQLQHQKFYNRQLSANGYLHLAYFGAEITLHRRIIRSLNSNSPKDLVDVCRDAAKARLLAAMEFVNGLHNDHLQAFWHFSASANFALIGSFAALLFVTSRNEQEANFYRTHLTDYMWTLRVSNGFEEMAAALRLLGITMARIPGLDTGQVQACC